MTSQPGKETIGIHILPNISRSKGNQTMTRGQLIVMSNIFLEKSYTNCGEKLFPDSFLKNKNWAYLISFIQFFYCMPSKRLLKYIETKLRTTCSYLIWSFLKNESGLDFLSHFQHYFWRKIFLLLKYVNWSNFHCLPAFTSSHIEEYVDCTWLKSQEKNVKYLQNEKNF